MKIDIGHVIFEVTRQCNYRCRFCYNHWKTNGSEDTTTPDYRTLTRTLDKLFSQANIKHLAFTGGEPLLFMRLPEIMLKAKLHNSKVTLLTNGSLINNDTVQNLKTVQVNGVQIPVLSHKAEIHDYLTQSSGSWERSVKAIGNLQKAKIASTAIMVVTALNLEDIDDTFSFLKSINCTRILLNRFNVGGLGLINQKELQLNQDQIKQLFYTADLAALNYGLQVSSGVCTPLCIADPVDYKHIRFSFCNTDLLHRPVTVDYLGNVRFCNHSPIELGNIFNETLGAIAQNKNINAIFAEVPQMCTACSKVTLCNGGCRAAAQQVGKGFNDPDPVFGV